MHKLLVVVVVLAACGDDPMQKPDAAVQQDAPNPPPPKDAAIDAPPAVRTGIVILAELRGANADTTASASFQNSLLFGGPVSTGGGCEHYTDPNEAGLSAGNITVTGTSQTINIVPSATAPIEYGAAGTLPADLFDAADTLSISAAGATVPAFSGTVMAPAQIANPVMPAAVSRANPPTLTWTAGTSSSMWLWVVAIAGSSSDLIWCRMPDNGSFAIPAAAIAEIPMASTSAVVFLWRTNVSPVTAGGYAVQLVAADAFGTDLITITQ